MILAKRNSDSQSAKSYLKNKDEKKFGTYQPVILC
jgi:hypothetical protein